MSGPAATASDTGLRLQAWIWPYVTACRALNPCDNSITSDQNCSKQLLFAQVNSINRIFECANVLWSAYALHEFLRVAIVFKFRNKPSVLDLLFLTVPATHAFGSPTGRRSSPGGRRSWGRGRGRPVCRSSRVRTWDTPFSCLQTSTKRQGTASYYSFWQDGAGGSCHPAHARYRHDSEKRRN